MSFFVLQRDDVHEKALVSFCTEISGHGMRVVHDLRCGRLRLRVFSDLAGRPPPSYGAPNGDRIIVLGSLVHNGKAPPACLPDLLSAIRPESSSWPDLLGTHVVVTHRDGRLDFFCDGLGASRLYHDDSEQLWSNAFLPFCALLPHPRFDVQACYEYVINGAVFGPRSLLDGVAALPPDTVLRLDAEGHAEFLARPPSITHDPVRAHGSLDDIAQAQVARLDTVFAPLVQCHGQQIRLSFSGGFDSRLMLAMLVRHGVRPPLFVYGDAADDDVRVARLICEREGLELNCIEKRPPTIEPDAFPELVTRDLFAFDGWKVEQPLFDYGVDRNDRLARHDGGAVPLNGSLGEIYRNFFYMPHGRSSIGRVISTFYSPYDPAAFTARFDEQNYRAQLGAAMRGAIGATGDKLERTQVEMLYPNFRGRYWTGRDAHLNQRFGTMFFPYLEPRAISDTAYIPLSYKDFGYLQGRMIATAHAALARYPSDYGFPLDGPRPFGYRLTTRLSTQRPAALRKLSFRLRHRKPEPRTGALAPALLERVIDPDLPVMRALFDVPRLYSRSQYGLAATLEYLAARYGISVPAAN